MCFRVFFFFVFFFLFLQMIMYLTHSMSSVVYQTLCATPRHFELTILAFHLSFTFLCQSEQSSLCGKNIRVLESIKSVITRYTSQESSERDQIGSDGLCIINHLLAIFPVLLDLWMVWSADIVKNIVLPLKGGYVKYCQKQLWLIILLMIPKSRFCVVGKKSLWGLHPVHPVY